VRHPESRDRQRGFFQLLQLGPQCLAVFVQLLQGFVAVDEIPVRSNPKLHMLLALEGEFLVVELKYLAGFLLVTPLKIPSLKSLSNLNLS
jgi:hypothetical protein